MLHAILFDLGDTLVDFAPMDRRAVLRQGARNTYAFFANMGCGLPAFERFQRAQLATVRWAYLRARLSGREADILRLLTRYCASLGLPHDRATVLEMAWRWYHPVTAHCTAEKNLPDMLAGLGRGGLKLGLVSNTFVPGQVMDRHLRMLGLLDFIPVRIYSSEVRYRKPHRRIFQMALDELQVPAASAMFVGDMVKADIGGAHRVGMKTVLKDPHGRAPKSCPADHVLARLTDLPALLRKFYQIQTELSPQMNTDRHR